MKVILKKVGEEPIITDIDNTLETLQNLVGGYIETITICTDLVLICDEEGKLKGKPYNATILGYPFVGDLVLVGADLDEFCDVPVSLEQLKKMGVFA